MNAFARYLKRSKQSDKEYAAKIGVTPEAVSQYRRGLRIPREEIQDKIEAESNGKIPAWGSVRRRRRSDREIKGEAA